MNKLLLLEDTLASSLHFSLRKVEKFIYYTIDLRKEWADDWDILGITTLGKSPLLFQVRLMHIHHEQFNFDGFTAEGDADSYIGFSPEAYASIVSLFETLYGREVQDQGINLKHFVQMTREELIRMHVEESFLRAAPYYYHYIRDINDNADDKIRVVRFPFRGAPNQGSSLEFETFSAAQVADPQFNLLSSPSLSGTLTFDHSSFEEFIILLKRYTW